MRIAFTGAQSTGKTTLLNALKADEAFRYKYEFIDEITRRMQKKGLRINEAGGNTTQLLIMNEHIKNLLYENVIMDRCMLDGVVYTDWLHWEGKVKTWVWEYASKVFSHYIDRYDIIFYLKPEFDIVDDGVRSVDVTFRDGIVSRFERYLKSVNTPVVTLSGSVEERLNQFKDTIKKYEQ